MNRTTRWLVIIGIGILVGIILLCAIAVLLSSFVFLRRSVAVDNPFGMVFRDFASNGERIYFTGTSLTGPPISSTMPGMHRMGRGSIACASCHGSDGRGGQVTMMMTTTEAPDIRYTVLTKGEHDEAHGEGPHQPYSDETIKRAITQGVDPAGNPLSWVMPRWDMTDEQFNDLLDFIKTLE